MPQHAALPAVAASSSVTLVAPSVGLCGEMKTWTVGMKWYLNDYVRLMFDYSKSDLGDYPVEEARGVGLANGSDLERALALLITQRRLEDRSFTAALEKKFSARPKPTPGTRSPNLTSAARKRTLRQPRQTWLKLAGDLQAPRDTSKGRESPGGGPVNRSHPRHCGSALGH